MDSVSAVISPLLCFSASQTPTDSSFLTPRAALLTTEATLTAAMLAVLHLVLLVFLFNTADVTSQKVELVNNGYKGLLIAVSESVPETPDFLDNLKVSELL